MPVRSTKKIPFMILRSSARRDRRAVGINGSSIAHFSADMLLDTIADYWKGQKAAGTF